MIDTHCHINDDCYINNPEEYIKDAEKTGVSGFLIVGFDLESSKNAVEIAEKYPNCFAAIGIHPSDVAKVGEHDYEELEKLSSSNKVVAIGEIGLDYYWDKEKNVRENQRKSFIKQIELANKLGLPISIHCRDAIEDCLQILREHKVTNGGIMHCYAGSVETLKELKNLGFLIGIGGVVTFKNAVKIKEVAAAVDSEWYVLETDAPYLAPDPYRGQPNHSKYLYLIRDKIAELRGTSSKVVEEETNNNFARIFRI